MLGTFDYSEIEMRLIEHFGFADICSNIAPPMLYPLMACAAFTRRDETWFAEALRSCVLALEGKHTTPEGKVIYRMTPEWDKMIAEAEENYSARKSMYVDGLLDAAAETQDSGVRAKIDRARRELQYLLKQEADWGAFLGTLGEALDTVPERPYILKAIAKLRKG
jgi:hypothetical protein